MTVFHHILSALFPKTCPLCQSYIAEDEWICNCCASSLEPARLIGGHTANALVYEFTGHFPIVRATSMLRYHPDTPVAELLQAIKYHHRPQLARHLGRWMAEKLAAENFFDDIDAIIPLPLTPKREAERGYNQSAMLAQGIADITHLPVRNDIAERTEFHISQTRLSTEERRNNVRNAFRLKALACHAEPMPHHPLLVDDVITTGASMISLGRLIPSEHISVVSLALAGRHIPPLLDNHQIELETSCETTTITLDYPNL